MIQNNAESGSESEDSNHNKDIVKTTTAIVEPKRKLSKRISKTNTKIEKSSPKQTNSNINQIEEISKKSENTIEETRMLKLMVHKLNKELSKYQKHGIDINDLNADEDFDEKTTNDLTKLGPLIVAYDEELHE